MWVWRNINLKAMLQRWLWIARRKTLKTFVLPGFRPRIRTQEISSLSYHNQKRKGTHISRYSTAALNNCRVKTFQTHLQNSMEQLGPATRFCTSNPFLFYEIGLKGGYIEYSWQIVHNPGENWRWWKTDQLQAIASETDFMSLKLATHTICWWSL